jgi:hypothetical protein
LFDSANARVIFRENKSQTLTAVIFCDLCLKKQGSRGGDESAAAAQTIRPLSYLNSTRSVSSIGPICPMLTTRLCGFLFCQRRSLPSAEKKSKRRPRKPPLNTSIILIKYQNNPRISTFDILAVSVKIFLYLTRLNLKLVILSSPQGRRIKSQQGIRGEKGIPHAKKIQQAL